MNDRRPGNPTFGDPSIHRRIDAICDRFEQAWRGNPSLRIEQFLRSADIPQPVAADLLFELIVVEMELREKDDDPVDRQEYLSRFPAHPQLVEDAFSRTRIQLLSVSRNENADNTREPAFILQPEGTREIPNQIGPYLVGRYIGSGSFGVVHLGTDTRTGKLYALKFPAKQSFLYQSELDAFFAEAASVIDLDHPGIVKTIDILQEGTWVVIVQQFIDGTTLSQTLQQPVSQQTTAELIAQIADAAAHAHMHGLVHRDIKPANILVDGRGTPYLGDFGLAVHENVQRYLKGTRAGTLAYMSPEMVEGQVHFLDGRSDIWSIGVIMYQMLVPRRQIDGRETLRHPFEGDTEAEIIDEIRHKPVKPPRQIDNRIDPELERICLCCLQKQVRDRYLSATDLANDLRTWLHKPLDQIPVRREPIIPAGLRAFGSADKDFFLQLLPGPRDKRGVPASILFWKSRIDSTDVESAFSTGLIYGPSGSGKSSFLQAGLLPRLASHVSPFYVEATGSDTEVRLIKRLRQSFPAIPEDTDLPTMFLGLREGLWSPPNKKILVVLDQFEQWLVATRFDDASQLIRALRHCDGTRLQCLLLVRDDFWVATSRCLKLLEVELVDGRNAQMLDLFDKPHARNVLIEFGRAYGRLFHNAHELTTEQERFLDQAIDGLAIDGRVICVHLVLFTELMKSRPWTVASLQSIGGISGVGERFLEDTFNERTADARLRRHKEAAIKILGALLPAAGTEIKGAMRSAAELMQACGYQSEPTQFQVLIDYLSKELRILTPTDPDAVRDAPTADLTTRVDSYYQLAHDYLVPSITKWIERGKTETWQGRSELRLGELENLWKRRKDRQFLPGPLETLQIAAAVPSAKRTPAAAELLRKAQAYYGFRALALAAVALGLVAIAITATYRNYAPANAVKVLTTAEPAEIPSAIQQVSRWHAFVDDELTAMLNSSNRQYSLHAAFAKLALEPQFHRSAANVVIHSIANEPPSLAEFPNVVAALKRWPQPAIEQLAEQYAGAESHAARARLALVALYLGDDSLIRNVCVDEESPDLRTELVHTLPKWHGDLGILARMIESTDDKSFRYAAIAGLGLIDQDRIDPQQRNQCTSALHAILTTDPDGGVHSVCNWTLRRWNESIPALPVTTLPPEDRAWWLTEMPDGSTLTFVRVGPGQFLRGEGTDFVSEKDPSRGWQPPEVVPLPNPYWVCTTETPYTLVRHWISQLDPSDPVRQLAERDPSWNTAGDLPFFLQEKMSDDRTSALGDKDVARFMNWLNSARQDQTAADGTRHENRELTWRIQRLADLGIIHKVTAIPFMNWISHHIGATNLDVYWDFSGTLWHIESLPGFRMPKLDEFEYAARGKSKTQFFWGSFATAQYVADYVAFNPYSNTTNRIDAVVSGTKIPNRFGIHDPVGNVSEYCFENDHYFQKLGFFIVRGFTAEDQIDRFVTGFRALPGAPGGGFGYEGIRIVYCRESQFNGNNNTSGGNMVKNRCRTGNSSSLPFSVYHPQIN